MYVKKLKMRVISPFYYYTHGGQIASPGDFLGDIALFYALAYSLKGLDFPLHDLRQEHLASLDFMVTVGKPLHLKMKSAMIVASVFKDALHKFRDFYARIGGSFAYKNIRKIKPIDAGSIFESYIISRCDYKLPKEFGLRIGVNRDGVLNVTIEEPNLDDEIWLNLFTLRSKGIPYQNFLKNIIEVAIFNRYYTIIKGVKLKDFLNIARKYI